MMFVLTASWISQRDYRELDNFSTIRNWWLRFERYDDGSIYFCVLGLEVSVG